MYLPIYAQNSSKLVPKPQTVDLDSCPPVKKIELKKNFIKTSAPLVSNQISSSVTSNFVNLDIEDGLAFSAISCGLKDKKGVLWFGTYGAGVSSYDGRTFTKYNTAQGLSNSTIVSIFQDKTENMWFGTDFGINIYDGKTLKELNVFKNKYISSITKAADGNFWLSASGKVFKYSHGLSGKPENGTFSPILLPEKYKNFGIAKILEDRKGNVWLVSRKKGILCYTGKVFPFDTTRFVAYTNEKEFVDNEIKCVAEDSNGNIWFGTHHGVVRFDGKLFVNFNTSNGLSDNVILTIENDKEGNLWFGTNYGVSFCDKEQLLLKEIAFSSQLSSEDIQQQNVLSITEDDWGNLWLGSFGGGLYRYNGGALCNYRIDKKKTNYNNVRSILEDRNGNLWFGSHGAKITFFDGDNFTCFDVPWKSLHTFVPCMFEDKNGVIWFGTSDKGFFSYSGKSKPNKNTTLKNYSKENSFINSAIRCITQDKKGNLWFGTFGGGATCFTPGKEPDTGFFTNYTEEHGLTDNKIWSILEDKSGILWFATNKGVCSFNGKSFTRYTTDNGLVNNTVITIVQDKNGGLWFGTNNGLSYFTGNANNGKSCFVNYTASQGLGDNVIYDMQIAPFLNLPDKENINSLIIGTNQGFSVLTGWKDKFGNFFPFEDNRVQENRNNYTPVWEIFNTKTGYPIKDLNTNSMCLTKKGFLSSNGENRKGQNVIWAGVGDNKIVRFDPLAIKRNLNPLNINIKLVSINDEKIPWNTLYNAKQKKLIAGDSLAAINEEIIVFGNPLSDTVKQKINKKFANVEFTGITKWYQVPENLVLPYEHNNVTIDFIAIQTDRNFLVRYQYMLEGYDKDWSPITDKTSAKYGNINEGTYTFKVKACSPEGIWSEPTIYSFKVLAPWYRTWWMYLVYVIISIIFIILIVKWNSRKLISQKKHLEQEVKKATNQIRTEKEKVEEANLLVLEQKKVVEEKNKDMLDSIHYAKRIQDAMLKVEEHRSEHLPDHFVLFLPKDIVSGDFYWAYEKEPYWYVAAVDCTGHGVPGAFMSLLGMSFLNDILSETQAPSPAQVLDLLRDKIMKELRQSGESGGNKDGMDISIIRLCLETKELQWAGANNPLLIIENGEMIEVKPDKQPIGYYPNAKPFTNHIIQLKETQYLYVFSDGYPDQFGGPDGKKFKMKQLKDVLLKIHLLPMEEQKEILKKTFLDWKGNLEQIDDICIIGLKMDNG